MNCAKAADLQELPTEELIRRRRSLLAKILDDPYSEPRRQYAAVSAELNRRGIR